MLGSLFEKRSVACLRTLEIPVFPKAFRFAQPFLESHASPLCSLFPSAPSLDSMTIREFRTFLLLVARCRKIQDFPRSAVDSIAMEHSPEGGRVMKENEARVLVVEDEAASRLLIQTVLVRSGFQVVAVESGEAALAAFQEQTPDIVTLDLALPGMDGFEVCRTLRAMGADVPILMLTALGETSDKVRGLDLGADDYLTKPFNPLELAARLRALLRRTRPETTLEPALVHRGLRLDLSRQRCFKEGREVALTRHEFVLLVELLRRPGRPQSRKDLTARLWGTQHHGSPKSLDVYIRRLREKVEDDPSNPDLIHTARGIGYLCS